MKDKKRRSPAGTAVQFLGTVLMLVPLVIAILMFVPKIMGYQEYAVVTGSMEPEIPVGSLVFVKETDPEMLRADDVISYERERDGSVITHRVVDNSSETGTVTTKGDANDAVDLEPVEYDQVLGIVVKTIPGAGRCAAAVSTIWGKIVLAALLVAGYLLSEAGSVLDRRD